MSSAEWISWTNTKIHGHHGHDETRLHLLSMRPHHSKINTSSSVRILVGNSKRTSLRANSNLQWMTVGPREHTATHGPAGGMVLEGRYRPPDAVHLDSGRELHVEPCAPNGKASELWDLDDGREPVGDRAPGATLIVGKSFPPDERPTVRRSAAALVLPPVRASPPPGPLLPDLP